MSVLCQPLFAENKFVQSLVCDMYTIPIENKTLDSWLCNFRSCRLIFKIFVTDRLPEEMYDEIETLKVICNDFLNQIDYK